MLEKCCKDRTREEVLASGISPEEKPLNSILQEIIEKTKEFEAQFQDQKGIDKELICIIILKVAALEEKAFFFNLSILLV